MKNTKGIFMKLSDSPYVYEKNDFKLYFSSEFYLRKFKTEFKEYIEQETMKLKIRYKNPISAEYYFMLVYYKKVEKRGYRVIYKGKELQEPPVFRVVI